VSSRGLREELGSAATPRALFAGTFDPPHVGHLDLARRAAAVLPLTIGIAVNPGKAPRLSPARRKALWRALIAADPALAGTQVAMLRGLTTAAARRLGCTVLVRGLRHALDLEAERALATVNRTLGFDTLFLIADGAHIHLSSRLVREAHAAGAPLTGLVPDLVARALR
jgi:pantetheine-phosphate adenylyltransferase